jgi:hypothetical protein
MNYVFAKIPNLHLSDHYLINNDLHRVFFTYIIKSIEKFSVHVNEDVQIP